MLYNVALDERRCGTDPDLGGAGPFALLTLSATPIYASSVICCCATVISVGARVVFGTGQSQV